MLNRPVLYLWLYIKINGKRRIHLAFFIPLWVFAMIAEDADDLLSLINLLSFGRLGRGRYGSAQRCIRMTVSVMRELMIETGPTDLADISVKNDEVRILCRLT